MSSRLAVLFCGEVRTWDQASKYLFNFVESLADSIDYYFVTWSKTSEYWPNKTVRTKSTKAVDEQQIKQRFQARNLINIKIIDPATVKKYELSFYYRAHLVKIANILKRRYELDNGFVYDQVIEIRPDLYIPKFTATLPPCSDFEYATAPIYSHLCELHSMPDLYIRSNSLSNDIISDRINFYKTGAIEKFQDVELISNMYEPMPSTRDPHWLLLSFLFERRMIQINSNEGSGATALRPGFPADLDSLTLNDIRELSKEYMNNLPK